MTIAPSVHDRRRERYVTGINGVGLNPSKVGKSDFTGTILYGYPDTHHSLDGLTRRARFKVI